MKIFLLAVYCLGLFIGQIVIGAQQPITSIYGKNASAIPRWEDGVMENKQIVDSADVPKYEDTVSVENEPPKYEDFTFEGGEKLSPTVESMIALFFLVTLFGVSLFVANIRKKRILKFDFCYLIAVMFLVITANNIFSRNFLTGSLKYETDEFLVWLFFVVLFLVLFGSRLYCLRKLIRFFLRKSFSKENYFKTIILIFAGIITLCMIGICLKICF